MDTGSNIKPATRTLAEALRDYVKNTPNFHGKELEKRNAIAIYFLQCGDFSCLK